MKSHNQSFFGQATGMVLWTQDWAEPWVMLTFIKKRGQERDAPWEKLAEGRTVKLALPEVAAVLAVCKGKRPEWRTYHSFKGEGTPISARLERNQGSGAQDAVIISAGGYTRPIAWPELVVLTYLLDHLLVEKVAHATGGGRPPAVGKTLPDGAVPWERPAPYVPLPAGGKAPSLGGDVNKGSPIPNNEAGTRARAACIERVTPKAFCATNTLGSRLWIPKSALEDGQDDPLEGAPWEFTLKEWFAQKEDARAWFTGA